MAGRRRDIDFRGGTFFMNEILQVRQVFTIFAFAEGRRTLKTL
jgi:hypothetical protein